MKRQPVAPRARRITVTVDALALRGMSPADAREVTSALTAELQQRFADAGTADFGGSRSVAPTPPTRLAAPAGTPRDLGARAAAAIAGEVRR